MKILKGRCSVLLIETLQVFENLSGQGIANLWVMNKADFNPFRTASQTPPATAAE
ncbi:MAG: hypothetical protein LC650_03225 [Actinobacteria bacterium]|nr:hypothetical protein [Actinomycetota bacterium]